MSAFRQIVCLVNRVYLTVLLWSFPLLVWAREGDAAPKYEQPSWSTYMLCYILVVLCLMLGALVVCNPIHRRDKPLKKDQ